MSARSLIDLICTAQEESWSFIEKDMLLVPIVGSTLFPDKFEISLEI